MGLWVASMRKQSHEVFDVIKARIAKKIAAHRRALQIAALNEQAATSVKDDTAQKAEDEV